MRRLRRLRLGVPLRGHRGVNPLTAAGDRGTPFSFVSGRTPIGPARTRRRHPVASLPPPRSLRDMARETNGAADPDQPLRTPGAPSKVPEEHRRGSGTDMCRTVRSRNRRKNARLPFLGDARAVRSHSPEGLGLPLDGGGVGEGQLLVLGELHLLDLLEAALDHVHVEDVVLVDLPADGDAVDGN